MYVLNGVGTGHAAKDLSIVFAETHSLNRVYGNLCMEDVS